MKAIFYTAAYIGLPFLYLARAHHALYGILSPVQLALSLFLLINILICTWEMTLFLSRKLIRSQFEGYTKKFGKNVMPSPIFLFEEVSFSDAIGMEYWSRVWSTYSTLDPRWEISGPFRIPCSQIVPPG